MKHDEGSLSRQCMARSVAWAGTVLNEDTSRQEWQPLPAPRSLQLLYPRPLILIFGS